MDCRLEWALRALYTAPRGARRSCHRGGTGVSATGRGQVPHRVDERPVGFEQAPAAEARGRHPLERRGLERARRPAVALDDPERQLHVAIAVGVLEAHGRPLRGHFDPELLAQLARESCELVLAVGDLAAGKLPAARLMLAGGALRDEHAPALIVERRRHHQDVGLKRRGPAPGTRRAEARLLDARERAVTVFVFLARAARARLVASHLALAADEGSRRLGG